MSPVLLTENVWFVFHHGQLLLSKHATHQPLTANDVQILLPHLQHQCCLQPHGEVQAFCAELDEVQNATEHLVAIPLKKALEHLGEAWFHLAVKASCVLNWDKNHQFCGHCGQRTEHQDKSFERRCTTCHLFFYPRISPSIIVAIRREDKILMARSPHFTKGAYGLIAGFVEPGETLEETVHREVYEEVGIQVKNLAYFGSQSWPFPDSMLVGFTADYAGGEIQIDPVEISEADWYRYDQLPGRPSSKISISNRLLDHMINKLARS